MIACVTQYLIQGKNTLRPCVPVKRVRPRSLERKEREKDARATSTQVDCRLAKENIARSH